VHSPKTLQLARRLPPTATQAKENVIRGELGSRPSPWDPCRRKNLDVRQVLQKKGRRDAAIDRLIRHNGRSRGYAIPFLYWAKPTKKGKRKPAVKAYHATFDLYPHSEDGDKMPQVEIEKLQQKEIDKAKPNSNVRPF